MSSEEKAESLYGPAPEGDEDPHASQAVPDPGESPSYAEMTLHFSAAALNGYHLGLRVRVYEVRDGYKFGAVGQLTGVEHGAPIIEETTLGSAEETFTLGRRWVQLTFGSHSGTRVSPDATVELLD